MSSNDQSIWQQILQRNPLVRRKHDLRRIIIIGVVIVSISAIFFSFTNNDIYHAAPWHQPEKTSPATTPITPTTPITNTDSTETEKPPHHEVDEAEDEESTPSPVPNKEPEVRGQCTTWPVDAKGKYKPSVASHQNDTLESFAPRGGWRKPDGVKVKALVFYGRKRTVDFLDCYLQQNLVENGGYLDEIWFMVHTDKEEDLTYLDNLVKQRASSYRIVKPGDCSGNSYGCIWDPVVEDDTIYVKIDDDIIFIHPDAIPQLVHTRLAEPMPFAISANIVNTPLLGHMHYGTGAIHPFRADPSDAPSRRASESWRPSENHAYPKSKIPKIDMLTKEIIEHEIHGSPPYQGHPWLLLQDGPDDLLKTPMGLNELRRPTEGDGPFYGSGWASWMIASQQQYSLLQNLEDNAVWRYHFGSRLDLPLDENSTVDTAALKHFDPHYLGPGAEQLLDTNFVRFNLNFVALWGHDIKTALPIENDDEQYLTVTAPKRLGRPHVIDTRAVVGHLSFYPQHEGVRETDLIDRWRAFANEMICLPQNQKTPFDMRCPGY